MNIAHWHLLLNHLPVIGALIGLLTLLAGFVLKNTTVKRTALCIFVFAAVSAIPSFLTGEGAEETLENVPGITGDEIERHEDLAGIFIWLIGALGVVAVITLLTELYSYGIWKFLYVLSLIISVATMISAKQVATSGGEIRHTEIRTGAPATMSEAEAEEED